MAKTRAPKKPTRAEEPREKSDAITPDEVHRLFGMPGPYDPKEEPLPTKGFVT